MGYFVSGYFVIFEKKNGSKEIIRVREENFALNFSPKSFTQKLAIGISEIFHGFTMEFEIIKLYYEVTDFSKWIL